MKELLQRICAAEATDLKQLDELCDIVRMYYTDNKRHKYSEISTYLMETDDIDYLLENLRRIQNRVAEFKEDEEISIKVFKLIDHITLELNRTKYYSKSFTDMQVNAMNSVLNQASKAISKANEELRQENFQKFDDEIKEFRDETSGLKDKVEDSYSQFVSILGIFSAVVLVFFGGMTAFGSLFSNMQNIGRYKLVFTVALVGMIIFNLIFMFLYVLAKLIKRDIAASSMEQIAGKNKMLLWLKRVWLRYPYMIMFNMIMFLAMIGSFIAWYGAKFLQWKI